jgi:2-oxoglutarate ferredoxin oxidoreductase subunit beta
MSETITTATPLTAKDFVTDQEVRWCPGCGDYSILAQVQKIMPTLGIPRENIVIVSGIGCSSRFPYYMNTYGKRLKSSKTGPQRLDRNWRWRRAQHWR